MSHDACILYSVRIDSSERWMGVRAVLEYMAKHREGGGFDLFVQEVDKRPSPLLAELCSLRMIPYCFQEDTAPLFHRTFWFNLLAKNLRSHYPIIALANADVLCPWDQIQTAVKCIRGGEKYVAAFGDTTDEYGLMRGNIQYTAALLNGDAPERILTDDTMLDFPHKRRLGSYAGMVLLDSEWVWSVGGPYNENIVDWGPDEVEAHVRYTKLGGGYRRIPGWAVHLYHPGTPNNKPRRTANDNEFNRINAMTADELRAEIAGWPWA